MIEHQTDIATADGTCSTFVVHPDRGGPFPVIVFLMDAPAIREELRDMARRFATSGYYVMLPNLYYRSGVMELGPIEYEPDSPWRKKMADLMGTLSIPMVLRDVDAMLAWADKDGAANQPVLAPRLKVSDLNGRSVMVHAGGDNYADQPAPLGGGGGRIACGVIK